MAVGSIGAGVLRIKVKIDATHAVAKRSNTSIEAHALPGLARRYMAQVN